MRESSKEERDRLISEFQDKFEIRFGYSPTVRRTKAGDFMFDEGGNEIIVGNLVHAIRNFGKRSWNSTEIFPDNYISKKKNIKTGEAIETREIVASKENKEVEKDKPLVDILFGR